MNRQLFITAIGGAIGAVISAAIIYPTLKKVL